MAYNSMKEDTENAKCSNNIYICTIDLQKVLPFLILTVSGDYKRNMYCYNLSTIYMKVKDTFMFEMKHWHPEDCKK